MNAKMCGNCGNYNVKEKRCKLTNAHRMKVNGCAKHIAKVSK